jgi:hypothetical protein
MMEVEVDKPDTRGPSRIRLSRGRPEITRQRLVGKQHERIRDCQPDRPPPLGSLEIGDQFIAGRAARTLAIELQLVEVRGADEFDRAFAVMVGNRADARSSRCSAAQQPSQRVRRIAILWGRGPPVTAASFQD